MPTVLTRLLWAVLAAAVLLVLSTLAIAYRFAWLVVTPPGRRLYELIVRDINRTESGDSVTLPRNRDTALDGTYSLIFDGGNGHAMLGEVVSRSSETVTRTLLRTQRGELAVGDRTRFNGWIYAHPNELGLPWADIELLTPLGAAPAWIVGTDPERNHGALAHNTKWAIHIHGRSATRAETLRGVGIAAGLGMSSIVPSYRNDAEAPSGLHRRYSLGAEEWRDIEAAMELAVARGATSIVLYGWSMGATIALQLASHSRYREKIAAIVLDSPALDWRDILVYHAGLSRVTPQVARVGMAMLERGLIRSGVKTGIPFGALDAQHVIPQLSVPILVLHSKHDGYVPFGPSQKLAQRFPKQVTLVPYTVARHVKLWNQDPERYEGIVRDWLGQLLSH